jgi:iron complex transport system substrate-binding protein
MRILSLLPSATEIVFALGLGDDLVGVSHECDYPPQARTIPVVSTSTIPQKLLSRDVHRALGGHRHSSRSVYNIDEHRLRQLSPDVILTQELCTVCAVPVAQVREAVRMLAGPCQIVSLEPKNLRQILATIETVGEVTGHPSDAYRVVAGLQERIERVTSATSGIQNRPRVFCMEWMDPVMPGGHWIPEMIRMAGGNTALGEANEPSRVIAWEQVVEFSPEIIIVMPCGYKIPRSVEELDHLAARPGWRTLPAVQQGELYVVDSPAFFSRPGPRVVTGLEILAQILHPEIFSGLIPCDAVVRVEWLSGKPVVAKVG